MRRQVRNVSSRDKEESVGTKKKQCTGNPIPEYWIYNLAFCIQMIGSEAIIRICKRYLRNSVSNATVDIGSIVQKCVNLLGKGGFRKPSVDDSRSTRCPKIPL